MRKTQIETTPRTRRRALTGMASAAMLLGGVGATLAIGQQPAAANCDIPADIRVSDASVVEGTGSNGFLALTWLTFTITNVANATSVDWHTQNGPSPTVPGWGAATEPSDYYKNGGTVQLDGTPKNVYVFVKRDADKEPHEQMSVLLSNAKGCYPSVGDRVGHGSIYNDD